MWNATRKAGQPNPVVISLSKGVETSLQPHPHIITPTRIIQDVTRSKLENLLYLGTQLISLIETTQTICSCLSCSYVFIILVGGPNIASEVWEGEYATARICGISKALQKALAAFCSNSNFVLWENHDSTYENRVMYTLCPAHWLHNLYSALYIYGLLIGFTIYILRYTVITHEVLGGLKKSVRS